MSGIFLIAPKPSSVQLILGTVCYDVPGSFNDTNIWIYPRGPKANCKRIPEDEMLKDTMRFANKIVFVFQIPLPRESSELDFSRWQQNLIGVLQPEIQYNEMVYNKPDSDLTLDLRLAYRNKDDSNDDWKYYAHSIETRDLHCVVDPEKDKYMYHCDTIPIFEMGSLHHDYVSIIYSFWFTIPFYSFSYNSTICLFNNILF